MRTPSQEFHALAPWLAGWFHPDHKAGLPFAGPEQEAAFDALARGWTQVELPALLEACARAHGRALLLETIDLVVATHCRREWAEVARHEGSNGVEDLARVLLRPLQDAPGFAFTLEPRDGGLQMHCTRCPHATLGAAMGISEYVAHLVCGGDPHIAAGFNPRMGFRRTRMLTTGHDHCDHFYFMQPDAPADGSRSP